MRVLALLCGGLLSAVSHAAVVSPQSGIEILFIDGVKTEDKRDAVELPKGQVQLVIKYNKGVGKGNSKKVFDSAPYFVTFEAAEHDLELHAPKVYSYNGANSAFKKSPEWRLVDSAGTQLDYVQQKVEPAEGFAPYYNLDELVRLQNEKNGVVFGESAVLVSKALVADSTAEKAVPKAKTATSNLEQLQAWYTKASKQERKEFRKWMIDQE